MTLEQAQQIINELDLNCTAQEFIDYYNTITIDTTDIEVAQPTIATFDKPYPWPNGDVIINNPANWKYYYYICINWKTFLQNIVPYVQGLQPLNDINIDKVIADHKEKLTENYINSKKRWLTVEYFKKLNNIKTNK